MALKNSKYGSGRNKITDADGVTTSIFSDGRAEARAHDIAAAAKATIGAAGLAEGDAAKRQLEAGPRKPGSTD